MNEGGPDLAALATGLTYDASSGIYRSSESSAISFPEDGHTEYAKDEDESFWYQHRNRCLLPVFRRFEPAAPFFDIGGGNGVVARHLQDQGIPCVLLEPGPDGIAKAKERGLRLLIQSSLQDAGFRPGSIPAAGVFDVLEHVEDDAAFLREIHHALEPGGRFYLTVPAYSWLWSQADVYGGHFRRYTLPALRDVLERTGFSIEFETYIFSPLPLPIWWLRVRPYRRHRRRGGPPPRESMDPHRVQHRFPGNVFQWLLDRELKWLSRGGTLPFGSSCLAVARAR